MQYIDVGYRVVCGNSIYSNMIYEMMLWQLPPGLMLLCVCLQFYTNSRKDLTADFIELFSGEAAISGALRGRSLVGSCHDLTYSANYDLTQCAGFLSLGVQGPQACC